MKKKKKKKIEDTNQVDRNLKLDYSKHVNKIKAKRKPFISYIL